MCNIIADSGYLNRPVRSLADVLRQRIAAIEVMRETATTSRRTLELQDELGMLRRELAQAERK